MRLRRLSLVLCLALGCGSTQTTSSDDEPTTAKEKQRREADAKGDSERPRTKWGGWRYTGDRDDCFFVVGRKCFKTEAAACAAARCRAPKTCETTGGGPATVACTQ